MKKRFLAFVLAVLTVLPLLACAVSENIPVPTEAPTDSPTDVPTDAPTFESEPNTIETEPETVTDTETVADTEAPGVMQRPDVLDPDKTYNILFIGNSCTSVNDIPNTLFPRIARSVGYNVYVERVIKGGWYLDGHADPTDEAGKLVDKALAKRKWDFVVIQEQVRCFVEDPVRFYDGTRALVEKIRENGATPILYSTWSYNDGHSYMDKHNLTYADKTYKIAAACEAISRELDIDVAYVGLAFLKFREQMGYVDALYNSDKVHSSITGSNLAALIIFSVMFNFDPMADDCIMWKPPIYKDIFRELASEIAFGEISIPDSFRTDSNGLTNKK